MISPGLALSLALAGCGGSDYMAQMPRHDAGPYHDGASVLSDTPIYAAPIPDAHVLEGGPDGSGIDLAPALDVGIDGPGVGIDGPGVGIDGPGVGIDGPGVGIDGPVIDASNESASRDSDESTRG